jgi:hypothetical protein
MTAEVVAGMRHPRTGEVRHGIDLNKQPNTHINVVV